MPRPVPTNSDDVIDSRDVIAHLVELDSDRAALLAAVETAKTDLTLASHGDGDTGGVLGVALEAAETALQEWDDENDYGPFAAFAKEGEDSADDWAHGVTIIREDYFTDYAKQLADDIGAVNSDANWPLTYIDWAAAARALKEDYTEIDFGGIPYFVR